ncbi:MAG: molybdopterin molybdotransferase MoeA [Actinobacteria bacterium]|nr:molybdopterin molybdotransferase MoeA [Actinomycetota bacterium]
MSTELFEVVTPEAALARLMVHVLPLGRTERVPIDLAAGRVAAVDVRAPEGLPAFARAAMDGFALGAVDTFGATEGLPTYVRIAGEVPMGAAPAEPVLPGTAWLIHTGGMLPPRADAVVMVEHTQRIDATNIEVLRPVAPGDNVVQPGEDVAPGSVVLPAGHLAQPHDAGALAALGITEVEVVQAPRLGIIASGDEVVPAHRTPGPGQVRDVNSTALTALARAAGAEPIRFGIAPDDRATLARTVVRAHAETDALVISAGSSVSARDLTAGVIAALGAPGILAHGISVKPGKPTIVAVAEGKPVFGLPGNPVSALVVFDLLVAPAIRRLLGMTDAPMPQRCQARLAHNIPSVTGRVDYVPARLVEREGNLWAEPIFGKSNLIFTMVRAHGLIQVPLDLGGLRAGTIVDVRLF